MKLTLPVGATVRYGLLAVSSTLALATQAVTIPNIPLSVQQSVKPMVMLVSGKDHRFFYEAYNDASDLDGDGASDHVIGGLPDLAHPADRDP